ncbi:type-F conjugative transfer system pilin assembly protein TrbC [Vibrio mediterranei]|uniref:type-F conjugative transfer system pilin assembly protein TrbC n=1 Tax=Vibrio mediterranei TaxID=689 RepID=UPI001EFD4AFB|nr:type-F conjugative transfer system pilin assembly protein TrbC [Vibrio mediterranei]MCG9658642.1 type-F conjugative transfer system pilin assembly protein TrbC [Vibrio mediterranei]
MKYTPLLILALSFAAIANQDANLKIEAEAQAVSDQSHSLSERWLKDAQSLIDSANQSAKQPNLVREAKQLVKKSEQFVVHETRNIESTGGLITRDGIDLSNMIANYTNPLVAKEDKKVGKPLPTLLVFISSSMPKTLLMELARQTYQAKGSLVIKGFIGGKLSSTLAFIEPIAQETGVNILIDPTMFDLFDVKVVPEILVISAPLHPCEPNKGECIRVLPTHDRIKGNVSLYYALEQFSWYGDTSNKALAHLNALNASEWESINVTH